MQKHYHNCPVRAITVTAEEQYYLSNIKPTPFMSVCTPKEREIVENIANILSTRHIVNPRTSYKHISTFVHYCDLPAKYRLKALGIGSEHDFDTSLLKALHSIDKQYNPSYKNTPINSEIRIAQLLKFHSIWNLAKILFEHGLYTVSKNSFQDKLSQ